MAKGIKYVKAANMFVVYWTKNQKDKADQLHWFNTKPEAESKLKSLLTIS